MKKNLYLLVMSVILTFIVSLSGKAQTTYYFGYDASGNRLIRSITVLKSAHIANQDTLANKQKTFDDLICNQKVRIYPNPTKGLLSIEIPFVEKEKAIIEIFAIQGAKIKELKVNGTYAEVDLMNQPPGMYILRISVGELYSEWKIIKD